MITTQQKYKFVKVEDFFDGYTNWHSIKSAALQNVDAGKMDVALSLTSDAGTHSLLIQFVLGNMFRLRFDPGVADASGYSSFNTRAIVMEKFDDLRNEISDCTLQVDSQPDHITLTTVDSQSKPVMKMTITYNPFAIDVCSYDETGPFDVFSTSDPAFYFTDNGFPGEYSVIHSIDKKASARYAGFGEQGGMNLVKNTAQLTFFNYDNMKYSQVYGRGPLENREPLYHSDPFFIEFNGVPGRKSLYGIYIDNPSQVCMDIGYLNSKRYMVGTRFGCMDYYFMHGTCAAEIIDAFTSIVGKSRLKPRYALGYQQGCYGYDTKDKVLACANGYRAENVDIPLDGIHVDVDIQHNHKTFTIDVTGEKGNAPKFPDPKGMFAYLRGLGVKCSTNITPIVSNESPNDSGNPDHPAYDTHYSGVNNNYFIKDKRSDAQDADARTYNYYDWSNQVTTYADGNFNSGNNYNGGINYGYSPLFYGNYPDFGRKEVRHWWGQQYQYLFDMGLEMVWQDMTTPAIAANQYGNIGFGDMKSFPARLNITNDFFKSGESGKGDPAPTYPQTPFMKVWNLYSYDLHKATYHGLNNLPGRENKRNFIIGRGCFAGGQRFAGLWTGDNASTWDFLKINISQCLALGLTGQAICGQDIGGFEKGNDNGQWVDPELLIRWTAAGAFLPWFRNHYAGKPGAKLFQEPFRFLEAFQHASIPDQDKPMYYAVQPVCKYYIELRYRLMQLFYDRMFENSLTGMPICRALFVSSDDEALFNDKIFFVNNEFTVGKDLLVAPIIDKGQTSRDVYLPAGSQWYCYMDNRHPLPATVEGGTTLNFGAEINTDPNHIPFILPIYVRAGSILPTIPRERYVGELNDKGQPRPITLNVYPCAQNVTGVYDMYLDDGVSRSSASTETYDVAAKDEYRQVHITHWYDSKGRNIKIERIHDGYTPKYENFFYVAVLHDDAAQPATVTINGKAITKLTDGDAGTRANGLESAAANTWYYNENTHISFIKVFDNAAPINIVLRS